MKWERAKSKDKEQESQDSSDKLGFLHRRESSTRKIGWTGAGVLVAASFTSGIYTEVSQETREEFSDATRNVELLEDLTIDVVKEQVTPEVVVVLDELIELNIGPTDRNKELREEILSEDFEAARPILMKELFEGDERLAAATDDNNSKQNWGLFFVALTTPIGGFAGYKINEQLESRARRKTDKQT